MSGNNLKVVNTNNWYQKMNIYGTNSGIITITGTDPSMQMLLITAANDVNYCSSNYQLSKSNGFTLTFQLYLTGSNFNSICAYFGATDSTSSFDANDGLSGQSRAVSVMIRSNVVRLYTNYGTNTIAASSNTSIGTNAWQTITVTYTPSVTNTWRVDLNGTNIITYNDSSYTTFASNQNTLWGFYGATSQAVSASIRAVDLGVKWSIPLSSLKNTNSFYPEECFINKLSTHSQTNAAAAFGLRLLKADYLGPIVNVRRESDSATLDFYADTKGNLGTTLYGAGITLLNWLAGSAGYITKWYDQTGNGRDVINNENSYIAAATTPVLDQISSAGKTAAKGIYSLSLANSAYTGATIRLRRSSDNVTSDFYSDVYGNLKNSTWTARTSNMGCQGIAWSPQLNLFAATNHNGGVATTNAIQTSPDGITWTTRTTPSISVLSYIIWAPEVSLFVATSYQSGTSSVLTSPDGINWTQRTTPNIANGIIGLQDIAWSGSLFVCVNNNNTANTSWIITSPDGITWTARTTPSGNNWIGVSWSPQLSLFVAVNNINPTTSAVATSPDGITWTIRTTPSVTSLNRIRWSPELSLFVAVGNNCTITSPNGIDWTSRSVPTGNWNALVWCSELSIFVATRYDLSTNCVMISPDGINWGYRTTPSTQCWDITWSPSLSRFVAVNPLSTTLITGENLTFTSWIGSSTAYVDTWYDQSGNNFHATQSTTGNQPVYNGVLKLLDFSTQYSFLNMGTTSAGPIPTGILNAPYTFVTRHGAVGSIPGNGGIIAAGGNSAQNQLNGIGFFGNYGNYWYANDLANIGVPVAGNTFVAKYDGTNRIGYVNNTIGLTGASSGYTVASGYQQYIGRDPRGESTSFKGQLYTLYIFNTSLTDIDRLTCTSTITQPKIGTPILDNMSSSGKGSARGIYALYRANSTYTGPTIRLRRSSDNNISNFYADVYGNLGTSRNATGTSFTSWIGASTAYVDIWYDQSGSDNHATQFITAYQPVYNGTLRLIDSQNSSTQFLNIPSGTVPVGTANAPYSFVFRHGTVNNSGGAFISAGIWSTNQSNIIRAANEIAYHNYWFANDFSIGTPSQRVTGNTVTVTYNGALQNGYINNTLTLTNSSHTGGTTAAGQQYLFRAPGGEYLNGQLYSVFIFGSALSDSDRMACSANPTDINIKYDGSTSHLYIGASNFPLTSGLDNYTYVCNYTPMANGFSVIMEQSSVPIATNNRASFMISNSNSLFFAGQSNDANMYSISYYTPRKTVLMCNHNLATGNVVVNDNGTIYSYTTASPSNLSVGTGSFNIGRNSNGNEYFNGNINEVIVFKNTLTTKESQIYFTPNAITRKMYRSTPRLQITDVPKDVGPVPAGAILAIDTQMLKNMSPGGLVTSWNGFTGYNSPVLNAGISGTGTSFTIPPYVSITNNGTGASVTTGQYLDAGSKTFNVNTNGGFTAIWYGAFSNTGAINQHERIFDFGNGQSVDNIIALRPGTGTTMAFYMQNGGTQYFIATGSGVITQNEWAVWTFRYTASSRLMEILKNGISYSAEVIAAAITDKILTKTWIGRSQWSGDYYSNINTAGLYVYTSSLTDAQVASVSNHLMYSTTSNMPSVLPESNNKVIRYGHILSQGFRNGQAMHFRGRDTSSYLDIQDVPNYPLTFCFWFYHVNIYGFTTISPAALCSADLTGSGIQFDIDSVGTRLVPAYFNSNTNGYTQFTNTSVSLNTWYHVAFSITPTSVSYYINGSLVQTVNTVLKNTNRIIIGKSGDNARPYNGYIADIRVYDYALSADELLNGILNNAAGRYLSNYNTPANYLVNVSNWYSILNTYQSGSSSIATGIDDPDKYVRLIANVANSSNTLFNSTRIQNYNSFTCCFSLYMGSITDHGFYFYCGATSSTTVPSGTAGTAANSSYYIYFGVTGIKGIYLFNDQGQQLAYSPLPAVITSANYVPITIVYNRSVTNTWTVNVASQDMLVYSDPNNTNWVSNISGDFWGIGARTTTTGMECFIRRVELSYTPSTNNISTTVNAQNNTKFPPGTMTAASTTFTGTSILDGVYTASQSASGEGGGVVGYYAFDNNPNTHAGEISTYNYNTGNYAGSRSTVVKNLITNVSTSYFGEWVQIQVPNAVSLNSFGLMGRQDASLVLERTPTTFCVVGSNDGSTWDLLHNTSGAQFSLAMQYFTCNAGNNNKYSYFRLIANRIGNSGATIRREYVSIGSWDLYTQMNTVNSAVIAVPPYSMTANTTTFAGASVYDGTYTLTASSTGTAGSDIFKAFNDEYGSGSNIWTPTGGLYNGNTGVYTGSTTTTVSGVSQSGEWIQIQVPNAIVLYSFSLNFWWPNQSYWPKSFLIAASNDGTTWTNIYDNTNASFVYSTAQTFIVTGSSIAYKYFRLIFRATSGIFGCDWVMLDQWKLYTNASNLNLMKFPPAPLTADAPVTFTTVNSKNWYNVMNWGTTSWYYPVLSASDPFKQLQLTPGSGGVGTYCNISGQPVMNYDSFTFSYQLYCGNTNNGDWIQLYFGNGGYQVTFSFDIYYYNGIRMYTTNGGNVASSATNWWNSTWNNIRVEYVKGPTNTWTLFFNETQIIQYSDPNWANPPGGTWGFQAFNGAAHFSSYIRQLDMTIAPQTLPGNSIVSGSYIASASTVYNNNLDGVPSNVLGNSLTNTSNIRMWHTGLNYSSGAYIGAVTTTVSGTSYLGDWIQIQTPNPLILRSFSIYPRQNDNLCMVRSPKNFVMAGSNDNSTWHLLHTAIGVSDWTTAEKYFVCNGPNVASKYTYFRLIVMAVYNSAAYNGPASANSININNLNLYTPITLNNSITPATPKGLLDGLTWKYFDGHSSNSVSYYTTNTYRNIGRFTNGTNIRTITTGQYIVNGGDAYSMEIFGYFRASVSGTYTFYLATDDGSYLWIGSNALVGYTTSNANIQHPIFNAFNPISCTVTLLAGTYYPIRIHYTENGGGDDLRFSFTPPGGTQTYNGQGYFFSGTGLDASFPQESAKIIKDITCTNQDGVYYILVNGISTPIPCLMNDCYDGGGWMMLMKGTRGDAFQYSANYWTTKNTLNAGDTTRNNADAKYNTYNYSTIKDVLAIFPDIPSTSYTNPYGQNGGSIFVSDGWTWMVNNWNETSRITPLTGFNTTRLPHQNSISSFQTYGINNPNTYNGFGGWCYSSIASYQHVFYSTGNNANVRWGFLFNNESNDLSSCDTFCGIGMGGEVNYSAGDWGRAGANWGGQIGINRTARFEMYGR